MSRALSPQLVVRGRDGSDWLRPTSYWMPRHVVESAWLEHAPFAFWLVDALAPRSIVELGTHRGFSYFVFCEAIRRLGLPTRAFAVDTWRGDDQAGQYGEEVFTAVSAINEAEYSDFSTLLRGYFNESLDLIADSSVDLLHIDGRHGYEDVRQDFASWLPKLSERGVVIFHDTMERQDGFGVWKFWSEVSGDYPSFQFEHEHGLGVLAIGPAIGTPLKTFLHAARLHPEAVRDSYAALGAAITRAFELEKAEEKNELLTHELVEVRRQLASLGAQLDEVHASTSWTVTRPLRMIGRTLRHFGS